MNPISLANPVIRPDASRSDATSPEETAGPPTLLNRLAERFGLFDLQRLLSSDHAAGGAAAKQAPDAAPPTQAPSQPDNASKSLEAQDRLGNFEIQNLMSTYNQAETLQSSVAKKRSDTQSSVIGKI